MQIQDLDKETAIISLFEECIDRVTRYIAIRIGNRDEAEDLASEVFVRAIRGIDNYVPTGKPLEAWLFRIAHNLTVDHLRKRQRQPAPLPIDDVPPLPDGSSIQGMVEHSETMREIGQAMQHLTETQRQVIALRFGAGMRPDEIAEIMGKRSGAVRWLQHAAIEKLRKLLNHDTEEATGTTDELSGT